MEIQNVIPVVFAADNNYVPYTGVAIKSLILHSNPQNIYRIFVLHTSILPEGIAQLERLSEPHALVRCVNVTEQMEGVRNFQSKHLTQETVYRLLIPDLFSQYEKVVYLDSDLIVLADIAEFYREDITGYLVGAVHDGWTAFLESYYQRVLGMSGGNVLNAGVLLINTALFKQNHIPKKCLQMLEEDACNVQPQFTFLDQDVINIVCRGRVRFLASEWNVETYLILQQETMMPVYKKEYFKAVSKCKILHFTGPDKPWNMPWLPKAEAFWSVAKQSEFYGVLLERLQEFNKNLSQMVPLCNVRQDCRIIIYGAGVKGYMLKMLSEHCDCYPVVLWVDRNAAELSKADPRIRPVEEIFETAYDQIAVAVEDKALADSIISYLMERGIPEEKIVWAYKPKEGQSC